MAIQAPEFPATPFLEEAYPFNRVQDMAIQIGRLVMTNSILHPSNNIVIGGPCAVTEDVWTFADESNEWSRYTKSELTGLSEVFAEDIRHQISIPDITRTALMMFFKRTNIWKPRSNADNPHGLETGGFGNLSPSDAAELAYFTVHSNSIRHANTALEISFPYQVDRYGKLASFAWLGSRLNNFYTDADGNFDKRSRNNFIRYLAISQPTLPIGVKNGLDGSIDEALEIVSMINNVRRGVDQSGYISQIEGNIWKITMSYIAPAVLVYRGGEDAKTPEEWAENAERAVIATDGATILDQAHGAEMACDPSGKYQKSVRGQAISWDLAIDLAGRRNYVGNITETSDEKSPMDPPLPIVEAQAKIDKMIKRRLPVAA